MSSFQGAHKVANELAEVLIAWNGPDTTVDWATPDASVFFAPQVLVADKDYRVLEVGYTVTTTGTNAAAGGGFSVGHTVDGGGGYATVIPVTTIPATLAAGTTISTSKGGTNSFSFAADGTGKVDSDGNAVLQSGDRLLVRTLDNIADGPAVLFFVRLAPIISKDVFA